MGLFQVESRAQMATLPRMKPDHFYDLVVEVAIIRPGPIVGKMVHPYLRRRNGQRAGELPHPSLEPILKRTLGVPLFQEQLLRMAMTVAGFTGGEAEELRRAMGFKRSEKRMKDDRGAAARGDGERRGSPGRPQDDDRPLDQRRFALYGFPESHAASFALIAYASAYLKCHHPAAFTCALLNNQPMGFYHPFTLVKDAQRHGVRFRPVDVTRSGRPLHAGGGRGAARPRLRARPAGRGGGSASRRSGRSGPSRRSRTSSTGRACGATKQRSLAEVGALNAFGLTRRSALWQVEKAGRPRGPLLRDAEDRRGRRGSPAPDDGPSSRSCPR